MGGGGAAEIGGGGGDAVAGAGFGAGGGRTTDGGVGAGRGGVTSSASGGGLVSADLVGIGAPGFDSATGADFGTPELGKPPAEMTGRAAAAPALPPITGTVGAVAPTALMVEGRACDAAAETGIAVVVAAAMAGRGAWSTVSLRRVLPPSHAESINEERMANSREEQGMAGLRIFISKDNDWGASESSPNGTTGILRFGTAEGRQTLRVL